MLFVFLHAHAVRQGRRDARLPCLRARPDRATLFYYRASRTGPVIKWAFGVVARFEWPTLPARSWIAWIYFWPPMEMPYELRPRRGPRRSDPALCRVYDALPCVLLRHVYLLRVARPPPYRLRGRPGAGPHG